MEEPNTITKEKVHLHSPKAEEPNPKVKKKVLQPFLDAKEPSPKVKTKISRPSSKKEDPNPKIAHFPHVPHNPPTVQGGVPQQISLAASGDGTVHKDWDSKKVLTEAVASMILGDEPEAGWMTTYKITEETEVTPNTTPFLLHSGVKDQTTLAQTLVQKKVGAEKMGVELEVMYFMNRKNRLDTQVWLEKYREKVLTSMPDSPAQDLELSKVELLCDYENKFLEEQEESILQKIKENEQRIELETGKMDLIAFNEARVEMIETAYEMKIWVQNGISEIRKIKEGNMIPAEKKATFTKGWSEKVKECTNRVSKILQTSLKVAKKTRDEKIFHTPEIKELLETLDKEASEIYEWKKEGKKLLEHLEDPERVAKENSQAKGDEGDSKGDGDTPARAQSSTPKPVAEFTPVRSKTFYRSKKTPSTGRVDTPTKKVSSPRNSHGTSRKWGRTQPPVGRKGTP